MHAFTMWKQVFKESGLRSYQKGHIRMALNVLEDVIREHPRFSETSVFFAEFSLSVNDALSKKSWVYATKLKIHKVIRDMLLHIGISRQFVCKMCYNTSTSSFVCDGILSHTWELRCPMLKNWVFEIRNKTQNRSKHTLRCMFCFYLSSLLPSLGFDTFTKVRDLTEMNVHERKECVRSRMECVEWENVIYTSKRKQNWVTIFCVYILEDISLEPKYEIVNKKKDVTLLSHISYLSTDEMEKLYTVSKENVFDELVYLLLLTTGMRVGALVCIQMKHVCSLNKDGSFLSYTFGKTMEKGGRWIDFFITNRVAELIKKWVCEERIVTRSDYLFPSLKRAERHISTDSIRLLFTNLCKKANLVGSHLHPHSLRHTYARLLLHLGNSVDIVSKLLGHSSISITRQYYMKETISDVLLKARIPWVETDRLKVSRECKVPSFLQSL